MINRLRNALTSAALWAWTSFDKEDVLTLLGLVLVGAGAWRYKPALGLIAPGAVLLWMFLPSRPPFFERSTSRPRGPQ